jgi:hypothetical protein
VLLEVLGEDEWSFSFGARRAVLRFLGLFGGIGLVTGLGGVLLGAWGLGAALLSPLGAISFPVNPQGRGDYYLRSAGGRTYCA